MDSANNEVKTYFGRCRCCLNYGYLKNMWTEYLTENGDTEIYGNMLLDCFSLSWVQIGGPENPEQMCCQCIKKLKDAVLFKQVVEDSHQAFLRLGYEKPKERYAPPEESEKEPIVSSDDEEILVVFDESEMEDSHSVEPAPSDAGSQSMGTMEGEASLDESLEYEQVEYLDEDMITQSPPAKKSTKKKRHNKWPKKLPKDLRYKTYKQYSEEDLKEAIEAVVSESMALADAGAAYKIPLNTLKVKVQNYLDDPDSNDVTDSKQYKFIEEIKTILTYTNATPYKSKAIRYYCAYCGTDGPRFEDGESLRTHTRTEHAADRIKKINFIIRPYWMNEILKLDINNLICTICCCGLDNWNHMFKHLKEIHNVVLDQAYTRIVPYVLQQDLKCALCHLKCSNFLILDGHMNAHYNNYICGDCGDTFVANTRLKQHSKIHEVGRFPCDHCGKAFTVKKYMQKHVDLVHTRNLKYKCQYCPEKLAGEYLRHLHVVAKHPKEVNTFTCEFCGKSFTWRPYYTSHLRKTHNKTVACKLCDKKFVTKVELANHQRMHDSKKYKCQVCQKLFSNKSAANTHMVEHVNSNTDEKESLGQQYKKAKVPLLLAQCVLLNRALATLLIAGTHPYARSAICLRSSVRWRHSPVCSSSIRTGADPIMTYLSCAVSYAGTAIPLKVGNA